MEPVIGVLDREKPNLRLSATESDRKVLFKRKYGNVGEKYHIIFIFLLKNYFSRLGHSFGGLKSAFRSLLVPDRLKIGFSRSETPYTR
jgi:hypothetical protein